MSTGGSIYVSAMALLRLAFAGGCFLGFGFVFAIYCGRLAAHAWRRPRSEELMLKFHDALKDKKGLPTTESNPMRFIRGDEKMNETVTTQFKLTDEYWSHALRVLYKYKRPFRYRQRWIGLGVFALGVALSFLLDVHRLPPIALIVVGVIEIVEPSITKWRFMGDFRSNPGRGGTITVEFGPESYRMATPNSQGEMKYSAPLEVLQTPAGLLIFPQKRLYFFIPVDTFQDVRQKSAITRRFQEANGKTKTIEHQRGGQRRWRAAASRWAFGATNERRPR